MGLDKSRGGAQAGGPAAAAAAAAAAQALAAPAAPASTNIQQAQQAAAVQAAANAAAAGRGPLAAQQAAANAAQAVAGVVSTNFCGPPGFAVRNDIPNEVRLLDGPNPVAIDRLPPGAIGTFFSDYLIADVRDVNPVVTFDATVQGVSGDGTLEQGRSISFSVERWNGCMYMTAAATPDTLTSGDVVEFRITGLNVPMNFPARAFRDVFPQSLRLLRESGFLQFQLLSGPYNPITSTPLAVGQDEGTSWTWRYRVTGSGCFRARGQFSMARVGGGQVTTNNAETNQVCVTAPQQPVAVPVTAR